MALKKQNFRQQLGLNNTINADVVIAPETLKRKSGGKWITAYIELPDGYDAADIYVNTVRLDNAIAAEAHPTAIEDYDNDGIPDLMVKFDRQKVAARLNGAAGKTALLINGTLADGMPFEGKGTVSIIK